MESEIDTIVYEGPLDRKEELILELRVEWHEQRVYI